MQLGSTLAAGVFTALGQSRMTLDLDDGSLGFPACAVDPLFAFSMPFLAERMLSFQSTSNDRAVTS